MAEVKKTPPSHPPYLEMITEALGSLKERESRPRSGSSIPAIAKWIEAHHGKEIVSRNEKWKKRLNYMLKTYTQQGKLTKVRASYKLSDEIKSDRKKAAKAPQEAKPKRAAAKPKTPAKPKKEAAKPKPKTAPAKPKTAAAKPKAAAAKPKKAAAKPTKAAAKPKTAAPKAKATPAATKKATPRAAAKTKTAAPATASKKRAAPTKKTPARKAAKK
ncbi:Histone H1-I [Tetrabaena socialis]|uniref:Histone H1-I n=1 Tax=Tetrabaena socialis TaxID=47790 RepID=A0A2J8AGK9_9CHLO|nr:Histone H1-I [Tetrabaena socialis]|eukprot:PNH11668.1 Histone H1-I [Tetrabaena socialis]